MRVDPVGRQAGWRTCNASLAFLVKIAVSSADGFARAYLFEYCPYAVVSTWSFAAASRNAAMLASFSSMNGRADPSNCSAPVAYCDLHVAWLQGETHPTAAAPSLIAFRLPAAATGRLAAACRYAMSACSASTDEQYSTV
jgi:hypothetical protein